MNLRSSVVTLVGFLTLVFSGANAQDWSIVIGGGHGHGGHINPAPQYGQVRILADQIARNSSTLLMYARQMAYIHDIRERIALDNFTRFDREAQVLAGSLGPSFQVQVRRLERSFDQFRLTAMDLRAFHYYTSEFRMLELDVRRLGQLASTYNPYPTPIPPAPGPFPGPFPYPGPGFGMKQTVKCASFKDSYTECVVAGDISRAFLVKQHSNSDCHEGIDWGYHSNTLWVDNGCRATFDLFVR